MKSILELKTEKILLRDIEGSDIDTVFRGLSNPDVIKHYGVSFDSLEETKEQMKWFADKNIKQICEDTWRWHESNPNGYEIK